jgi:predicted DNA binding protein
MNPPWDYVRFTSKYPNLSILEWCNFKTDFFQLRCREAGKLKSATRDFVRMRRKAGSVLQRKVTTGQDNTVLVLRCKHKERGSTVDIMQRYCCLPLFPYVLHGGWMKISALCFNDEILHAMFERLDKIGVVKIDSKTKMNSDLFQENFMIPISALVTKLTTLQADSLLLAIDKGYYQVPRATKFEDISTAIRVPRTTYEEHVRKAESKVINAVAPYLTVYFGKK